MTDILAQLEAAPEGNRELDWKVTCALCGLDSKKELSRFETEAERQDFLHGSGRRRYTTSLDAALTLVPEGWGIARLWEAYNPKDRPWWGICLRRDSPYRLDKTLGAPLPALALCIAALKAREQSHG